MTNIENKTGSGKGFWLYRERKGLFRRTQWFSFAGLHEEVRKQFYEYLENGTPYTTFRKIEFRWEAFRQKP